MRQMLFPLLSYFIVRDFALIAGNHARSFNLYLFPVSGPWVKYNLWFKFSDISLKDSGILSAFLFLP